MELINNNTTFLVVKSQQCNPANEIVDLAKDIRKTQHIAPNDACKCTGNCGSHFE